MNYGITREEKIYAIDILRKKRRHGNRNYILIDNKKRYLNEFSDRFLINPLKYLELLEERIESSATYAKKYHLKEVFITFTSANHLNKEEAYKEICNDIKKVFKMPSWTKIDSHLRLYVRIIEPHKSGIPHFHIIIWLPEQYIETFFNSIFKKFHSPKIHIMSRYIPHSFSYNRINKKSIKEYVHEETNNKIYKINDSMKDYFLKTIRKATEDLESEDITDLSAWYILNESRIFSTSRTLAPIEVYKKIKKHISLFDLTMLMADKIVAVWKTSKDTIRMISINDEILWEKGHYVRYSDKSKHEVEKTDTKILSMPRINEKNELQNIVHYGKLLKKLDISGSVKFEIDNTLKNSNVISEHKEKNDVDTILVAKQEIIDNNNKNVNDLKHMIEKYFQTVGNSNFNHKYNSTSIK